MPNLYIIDGASDNAKYDLLGYLRGFCRNVAILRKYTTRKLKPWGEDITLLDLDMVAAEEFKALVTIPADYVYLYDGYLYGFPQQNLKNMIK